MLNEKAQVMILLREASTLDCLAAALDIVTGHTRSATPDWPRIRVAVDAMLTGARPRPASGPTAAPLPARKAG